MRNSALSSCRLLLSFIHLFVLIVHSSDSVLKSSVDEAWSMAVCGFRPEGADRADVGYEVAFDRA